jgi:hypothetical protein
MVIKIRTVTQTGQVPRMVTSVTIMFGSEQFKQRGHIWDFRVDGKVTLKWPYGKRMSECGLDWRNWLRVRSWMKWRRCVIMLKLPRRIMVPVSDREELYLGKHWHRRGGRCVGGSISVTWGTWSLVARRSDPTNVWTVFCVLQGTIRICHDKMAVNWTSGMETTLLLQLHIGPRKVCVVQAGSDRDMWRPWVTYSHIPNLFQWSFSAPYRSAPRAAVRLARPLNRFWVKDLRY